MQRRKYFIIWLLTWSKTQEVIACFCFVQIKGLIMLRPRIWTQSTDLLSLTNNEAKLLKLVMCFASRLCFKFRSRLGTLEKLPHKDTWAFVCLSILLDCTLLWKFYECIWELSYNNNLEKHNLQYRHLTQIYHQFC